MEKSQFLAMEQPYAKYNHKMENNFLLTIIKIEGLGHLETTNILLSIENDILPTFQYQDLPYSLSTQRSKKISITLQDTASLVTIASLSFDTSLLTSDWFYWLPLFLSPMNNLESLPLDPPYPKILLAVNKPYLNSHAYPQTNEPEPIQVQNFELNEILPNETSSNSSIPNLDRDLHEFPEILNEDLKHPQSIEVSLNPQIENFKTNSKIKKLKNLIKKLQLELIQKEKTFKAKIKFIQSKLNQSLLDLDLERRHRETLQEQLERTYKILSLVEQKSINIDLSPINQQEVSLKQEKSFAIFQTFHDEEHQAEIYGILNSGRFEGFLDRKVREILKRFHFEGLMRKNRELNYKVGNKVVTLCIKQGEVCCRSGLSLEKYIFNNCREEIESLLRQKNSPQKRSPIKSPNKLSRTPGHSSQKILRLNI